MFSLLRFVPVAGAKTITLGSDLVLEMEVLTEASSVAPALTPCSGGAP